MRLGFARALLGYGAVLALTVAAGAAEYRNPIMPGDWSDAGMIRVGDSFYTIRSSFGWQPGVPIAQSKDLVHWRYIGHAFTTLPKLQAGDTRGGIWGVELGYNPNTHQFLIYAPTRDYEVFVFSSDKPEGPYQCRSLGQHLGIDPGFFADADGRLYLILNRAQIYELTADGLAIKRLAVQIDHRRYRYFEGPAIFRHGGWYYVLFSDGGTLPHQPSTVSTLRARAIEGPWEPDPHNPVLFSTDNGAQFQGPAHGTLLQLPDGAWYVTFHAHELAYYSLGRELLMQPVEWTSDGWWRPTTGRVPTATAPAPDLPPCDYRLAQSDDFSNPDLGLQWFFTCPPDLTGASWSLTERPGHLRIHSLPGDLGAAGALPGIFQQRVVDKRFSVETRVRFAAREGKEAAGLHFFHDSRRNFWLASTVREGRRAVAVGKYVNGVRQDLWTEFPGLEDPVDLKISVDGQESARFFYRDNQGTWQRIGGEIYFGAGGGDLRGGRKGDPDLGWVGVAKSNLWTATTFGVFAVRDGAAGSRPADFDYVRVTKD